MIWTMQERMNLAGGGIPAAGLWRGSEDEKPALPPSPDERSADGPGPLNPATGQHSSHVVLLEPAGTKPEFVRPIRHSYVHRRATPGRGGAMWVACGAVTTMGDMIARTYARDPGFYGSTFCMGCGTYLPVAAFDWDDGAQPPQVLGS